MSAHDIEQRLSPAKRELLAARLKGRGAESDARPLVRRPASKNPLSFGQERILFQSRLAPASTQYHVAILVTLDGPLDENAFCASLDEFTRRHEILRTGIEWAEGRPAARVRSDAALSIARMDLRGTETERQDRQLREAAKAQAQQPFDLSAPPLLRATLVTLGAARRALLLTVHHIVWDGWSSVVMIREIKEHYSARVAGCSTSAPKPSVQYGDFAFWQRRLMESDAGRRQLAYWTERLSELPPLSALPIDHPRSTRQRHRGAEHVFLVPKETSGKLTDLCRELHATPFVMLLAVFKLLVFHLTNEADNAIGTTIAYRTRPEFEQLVGFFTNVLVIRTNVEDDPSFAQFVARLREIVVDAQANQDVPFDRLVEELAPKKRDLSYNPLFQLAFVLHNLPSEPLALPGVAVAVEELGLGAAAFDLVLHIFESGDGLRAKFEYDVDLFDEATIIRFASYFRALLDRTLDDPKRRVGDFSLLDEEEKRRTLALSSALALPQPSATLLHEMIPFARNAEKIAVSAGAEHLSYRELAARSDRLAQYLRRAGVGPDDRVALFIEPSCALIVAILAILKADGAYVPIDPAEPAARIHSILEDCRASMALSTRRLVQRLAGVPTPILFLDGEAASIDAMPSEAPTPRAREETLAYSIYTSGSTGAPKGVMVTHRNAVASTSARHCYYREDVSAFLLLSSIAFDSSVAGAFWTLSQGGRLCLPDERQRNDPAALAVMIRSLSITHLLALPSLHSALLRVLTPTNSPSLRCAIVAGEECRREIVTSHFARLPETALYNEYGPTEGTVWSTVQRLSAEDENGPVRIGRPAPGVRVHVVSRSGDLAPIGTPGELLIGGAGVARGYCDAPDLTAERFLPDPFVGDGARLYRSGDLGRLLGNGEIEFLGRIDRQIKVRGRRIEPGEIESALLRVTSAREAIVVARTDEAGVCRLFAHVGLGGRDAPSEEAVRRDLATLLPAFMVPERIVMQDALPHLPNGKIDVRALPEPLGGPRETVAEGAPLTTDMQTLLAAIWGEVLAVETVGASDNFFDLGGNSLSAIQVIARVQQLFGGEIPVAAIFASATLAEFAVEVEAAVDLPCSEPGLAALLDEIECEPASKEGACHV